MMKQQLYGVIMVSPLQALSNITDVLAYKETRDVHMFESAQSAFQYIIAQGNAYGMPGHATPIGPDLNQHIKLPSIGIMYRLCDASDMVFQPQYVTSPHEKRQGIQCSGPITPFDVFEQKAILVQDAFHSKPVEPVEISELHDKLSQRLKCFDMLERALENTPDFIRRRLRPEYILDETLQMALGPDSPIYNHFMAPYPQDQAFWDIQKKLWDNNAGFPYVVDTVQHMYNLYRNEHALQVVRGDSETEATAKASDKVLHRLMQTAAELDDTDMEDVITRISEEIANDGFALDEESCEEP